MRDTSPFLSSGQLSPFYTDFVSQTGDAKKGAGLFKVLPQTQPIRALPLPHRFEHLEPPTDYWLTWYADEMCAMPQPERERRQQSRAKPARSVWSQNRTGRRLLIYRRKQEQSRHLGRRHLGMFQATLLSEPTVFTNPSFGPLSIS